MMRHGIVGDEALVLCLGNPVWWCEHTVACCCEDVYPNKREVFNSRGRMVQLGDTC